MAIGLFSTYRSGENRVTASILAVLGSLSVGRAQRLLGALMEEPEFELIRFENQPSRGGAGVPDALIQSSCTILIETKTSRNSVRAPQLRRHAARLDKDPARVGRLLVLTPDAGVPKAVESLRDERVVWASFVALDEAINELLADPAEVVSEREAFLLRELQAMLAADGLIQLPDLVAVVAARDAWSRYQKHAAYICQPGRTFKPVQHLGFYLANEIKPVLPRVLEVYDQIQMVPGTRSGDLGKIVDVAVETGWQEHGAVRKVFLLTPEADPRTVHLPAPIRNDLTGPSDQTVAFTFGQRYVRLSKLRGAAKTSDLVRD